MHDDPQPHRLLDHLQFPGEDSAYRNALLDEEIALRRQIDLIHPLWYLLDTTPPEGRGDFQPALAYS